MYLLEMKNKQKTLAENRLSLVPKFTNRIAKD